MNEVTKIHLARQAFTISVDAHHELKRYIEEISKQVKDKEVVEEIELRMSELLIERGVDGNKVILPKDVDYLKEQLGSPADFGDGDMETDIPASDSKRLFRDPDNALAAGICAGLSHYFGVDVLLFRIIFVVLTFITAGWMILIYILLWLLIPEARTSSERLLMAGKPINVKSLKAIVDDADFKGATKRVGGALNSPINRAFRICLKITGILFVLGGLASIFGLIAGQTYFFARSNAWYKNNIFPVGVTEHVVLYIGVAVAMLLSLFVILFGIAIYKRRWPIKTWVTGVLFGLALIGITVGGALGASVYPTIRNAYNANTHSYTVSVKPFTGVTLEGDSVQSANVDFYQSNNYQVVYNYYGHADINAIKTSVNNNVLTINGSGFNDRRDCSTICIPNSYELNITIYAPNAYNLENGNNIMYPTMPFQPEMYKYN